MQSKGFTHSSNNGFTVIETLIIIVIIGLLGAIATPSWLAFINSQRLKAGQDRVYWAMRQAQSNAKRDKVIWQASFRDTEGVVQWAVHPASVAPKLAKWHSLDSALRIDAETTYPLLSNGVRRVEFGILGEVKTIPFGRITLSPRRGGKVKRCVIVSTILGAMRTGRNHAKLDKSTKKYCY